MQAPLIVFGVALVIRVITLALHWNAPIEMDGAEYVRLAQNILGGSGYVGIRGVPTTLMPPMYPLLIAGLTSLRFVDAEHAAALVSAIAGSALAAFIYVLAYELYGRSAARIAAAFAIVLPSWVQLSTVALSEMTYAALVVAGLWLLLRTFRTRRVADAAGTGIPFALAACVRPDGLVLCAFAVLALAFGGIALPAMRRLALTSAAASIVVFVPYLAFVYAMTGHVGLESKSALNFALADQLRTGAPYLSVADAIDQSGRPIGVEIDQRWYDARATPPPSPPVGERARIVAGALAKHTRDVFGALTNRNGGLGLLLVLALAGLIAAPWNDERRRKEFVMIGATIALYVPLAAVWHFWDRFAAVLFVPVIVWAAQGSIDLGAWSRASRLPNVGATLAAIVVAVSLAVDVLDMRAHEPAPERDAARRLAQHGSVNRIVDISDLVAFYSGSSWSPLPYGATKAAERYLDTLHPDVVVIDTRRARDYPPLATWFTSGPPTSRARLEFSVPAGGTDALRIYRWHQPATDTAAN